MLKYGHDIAQYRSYDGKAFFAKDHPVNPYNTGLGSYANLFEGAASGTYPGGLALDDSVTADQALKNLAKILSYISSIKMPNGEDPRFLRPKAILCSPRMFPFLVQLTSAKFLASAAIGGGVGTSDVEALIKALGFATPIQVDELAGFEDDATCFIAAATLQTSQLGAVLYTEREAYRINYYGTVDQAELSRRQELEWHCHGRNSVSPGHPYLLFKVVSP
jgi:hypothetical protein